MWLLLNLWPFRYRKEADKKADGYQIDALFLFVKVVLLKSPNKLYKIKKMRDTIQSQTVF